MRASLLKIALAALALPLLCGGPALAQRDPNDSVRRDEQRALTKPDAKKAKKLAELAAKDEAAGDYLAALDEYTEAARYAPLDVNIVAKGAALRSRLVREHVDNAEKLAVEGNLDGATLQMAAALEIDPGNPAVLERLQQMELLKKSERPQDRDLPPEGLMKVFPDKVTRTFHIRGDLQSAYTQIAQGFGLKVDFDPDLPQRRVSLDLRDADFESAMKAITTESGTFWVPLDKKLILVAAESTEKHRAYDPIVEQTFSLSSAVDATEITDMVRATRDLTGITHISQSVGSRTVTVKDTVERVHLASEILHSLEHAQGEVLLEIDFLEVDRNKARDLGITPPASTTIYAVPGDLANSLRSAPSLTALLTLLAQIFGGPAGAAAAGSIGSLASSIPPVAAFGGGKTTYLLQLPTFSAKFSEGLSLVHSGDEVLMRAQDGKPATFFVGERYPITLSLLSASLGTGSSSPTQTPNVGGTGFTIQTEQFAVGKAPVAMVTADFRSSGSQDLAVVNQIDNTLTILLNQGVGAATQFAQPTTGTGLLSPVPLGTSWTDATPAPSIATGSFNSSSSAQNNDNFADLLVTDPVGNTVIVLLGEGDGSFRTPATPIAVGHDPSGIVVGTFNTKNSDNNQGFVVTNFQDNTYSVFNGNGDGTFTQVKGSPFALPTTATGPIAITTADFNADGYPDLAILNQTTKNVTILAGNGDGTFTEFNKSPLAVGNTPVSIASGALGGSNGPALAIVNQADKSVSVYLGNGDGTFVTASQSPLATDTDPTGIVIADFLSDSSGGIAVTNTGAGTVTVFADVGSGLFATSVEPAAGTNPVAILAGDFTNNAFPDIAVTNNISDAAGLVTVIVSPASVISNGTTAQQPYPGSEYVDIGLKVKATPQMHANKEVTLSMEFEIKALSGNSVNGIPIISNRQVTQVVRLKEDETSLVTGLLSTNETRTLSGLPGLAPLPVAGYFFGNRNNTSGDDEFLILITPRRVRSPYHDAKTIYAGRGDVSGRGAVGGGAPPGRRPDQEPVFVPAPVEAPAGQPEQPPAAQPPAEQPPAAQPSPGQPETPPAQPPSPPPGQQPNPSQNPPDSPPLTAPPDQTQQPQPQR